MKIVTYLINLHRIQDYTKDFYVKKKNKVAYRWSLGSSASYKKTSQLTL